jgi:Cse1
VPAARYRNQFMTEALSKELEYCQQAVQPLLGALQRTTAALPAAAGGDDAARLRLLLSSARLACRVFYSLNSPGLTEARHANDDASPSAKERMHDGAACWWLGWSEVVDKV